MLNWWVLYGVLMSFWLIFWNHNRVIAPSNPVKAVAVWWLRAFLLTGTIFLALSGGIPGSGYGLWFLDYIDEHSMIWWWLLVVPITIALWVIKFSVFATMTNPGHYDWWENDRQGQPSLHKLDMTTPLVWNCVYYGWLLLSPWLPFNKCFLRGFLLSFIN